MSSYHSVLKNAQARMEEAGYGEQSALLYMLELTNKEAHNLSMKKVFSAFSPEFLSDMFLVLNGFTAIALP